MLHDIDPIDAADVAIVVREKVAPLHDVVALCAALRAITARSGARLLVHTHAAVVGPQGLDGVHLDGRADAHAKRLARLQLPPRALLGVSRHADDTRHGVLDEEGVDYATLSPLFSPSSKPDDTRPTLGVRALAGHGLPVFALGGIDVDNAGACVAAGAAGVAVIGVLFSATDPRRALLALLAATARAR